MKTFYIANNYERRVHTRIVSRFISDKLGWSCTSRWLDGMEGDELHDIAFNDVTDCLAADEFVFINNEGELRKKGRGKYVELGLAIAAKKNIHVIGPRSDDYYIDTPFLHWVTINVYPDYEDFVEKQKFRTVV